jgi:hypothetical protein
MAKTKSNAQKEETTLSPKAAEQFARLTATLEAPADFDKKGGDLVGFWDSDLTPIQCIPRSVKLFDGQIEADKPSILMTVELTKPAAVRPTKDDESGEPFAAPAGSLVGVWYKPGMKSIRDLCGVEVWMRQEGEKDTGKPNPMKLYDITWKVNGTRIPVTEDLRDKSKPIAKPDGSVARLTDFDVRRPAAQAIGNGSNLDGPGVQPF